MSEPEAKREIAQAKEELLEAKTRLKELSAQLMELSEVMKKREGLEKSHHAACRLENAVLGADGHHLGPK